MEDISMTVFGNYLAKKASAKDGAWAQDGAEGHRLVIVTLPAKETQWVIQVKYPKFMPRQDMINLG